MKWKMVSSLALKHEFELETDNMVRLELVCEKSDIADKMQLISGCNTARRIDEWHEDYGDVLWWAFPIVEPPYCGTPLTSDWPDYHTHWTPIITPEEPILNCVFCKSKLGFDKKYEFDEEGEVWCIPCFENESDTGE